MPGSDSEKAAWLQRVLGIAPPVTGEKVTGDTGIASRLAELESRYLDALRVAPGERSTLESVWAFVRQEAAGGDQARANKALTALEAKVDALLRQAPQSDAEKLGIRPGLVAERVSELEKHFAQQVAAAKSELGSELGRLVAALAPYIEEPQQLADAVRTAVMRLLDGLEKDLGRSLSSGSIDEVEDATTAWFERADADPVVIALRETCAALGIDVPVDAVLGELLNEVIRTLDRIPA